MIITCPQCKTDYRVGDDALGPAGRKVKCKSCAHVWLAGAVAAPGGKVAAGSGAAAMAAVDGKAETGKGAAGEPLAEFKIDRDRDPEEAALREMLSGAGLAQKIGLDVETAARRSLMSRRRKVNRAAGGKSGGNRAFKVAAVAAVLALACCGALAKREQVARLLPGTARSFASLGYPVNLRGLEFRNVTFRTEIDNGVPVLAVSGDIVNVTSKPVQVPDIRFSLRNATRHEVYHWTGRAENGEVAPDGQTAFVTRLASPPLAADHLQIHFVDAGKRRLSGRL